MTSLDQAAEIFYAAGISQFAFNPRAYFSGAYVQFTSQIPIPGHPYFIGFMGSAWERENGGSLIAPADSSSDLERMADMVVRLNNRYGNIAIIDGACPPEAMPSLMTRMIKERSRQPGNKEVYAVGVHPGTEKNVFGKDDLYANRDAVVFTNAFKIWYGDYENAFADRDTRNIDWADAVILLNGGIGTAHEGITALQKAKIVAPYVGTGGAADGFKEFVGTLYNNYKTLVIYESAPEQLVKRVVGQMHLDRLIKEGRPFSVADIQPHHSHLWRMKREEEPLIRTPAYRSFPFSPPKKTVDRTIFPYSIGDLEEQLMIKPEKTRRNPWRIHPLIKRLRTWIGNDGISQRLAELRDTSREPFVWHYMRN